MTAGQETSHIGDLGGVVRRGVAMAGSGFVIVKAVAFLQMLVIGRLLGPEEIGVYTAGSVLMGFVMVISDGSFSQAVIQREHDIEDAAETALIVTVVTGLLLSLAALAVSPVIGGLFHNDRVGLIAAASSGLILLHSLTIVPNAMMQRAFQFSRQIVIGPVMSITFAVVAIIFSALGFGAWGMVIGSYASMIVWVVLTWTLTKWRPRRGRFSFRLWREMARFSWPVVIDGVAGRVRESLEQIIVGRKLGTASLGQYRYAFRIGSLPSGAIIHSCSSVLFPAFSRIAGEEERLRQAFLRALGWLWLAAIPVAALMILVGEPIMVLLLGEEWRPAGNATEAMAGMGLGLALCSAASEAMKGAGKSSALIWLAAIDLLGLVVVLLSVPYGLIGVGIAVSVTHIAAGIASVVLAKPIVKATFREIGGCLVPSASAGLAAFAVAMLVRHFVIGPENLELLPGLALIIALCLLFMTVYLAGLRLLSPARYYTIHHLVGKALSALKVRRATKARSA
jgi:O-antigen/teichoic acid export membrane protein